MLGLEDRRAAGDRRRDGSGARSGSGGLCWGWCLHRRSSCATAVRESTVGLRPSARFRDNTNVSGRAASSRARTVRRHDFGAWL